MIGEIFLYSLSGLLRTAEARVLFPNRYDPLIDAVYLSMISCQIAATPWEVLATK